MENRFEHNPPEEKQGWGAYATPPPYSGQKPTPEQSSNLPVLPHDLSMCDRVREKLPYLLENDDGEISADTSRALFGHLSVCAQCSELIDEHQRLISYLEAIPAMQMPMDFTGAIQRRIQVQAMQPQGEAVVTPSRAFGTPSTNVQSNAAIAKRSLKSGATVISTLKKTQTSTTLRVSQLESGMLRRFTTGSITAAIMAYFVSSGWGREMLGANVTALQRLMEQASAAVGRIPLVGRLALLGFTACAQIGHLLGDSYRTVGDIAVHGLAMDIGLCMAAYYFLVVRRQRDSSWIRRA